VCLPDVVCHHGHSHRSSAAALAAATLTRDTVSELTSIDVRIRWSEKKDMLRQGKGSEHVTSMGLLLGSEHSSALFRSSEQ
jgi:hypothetical protein